MINVSKKTDNELYFIADDCSQAIAAMPLNAKTPEYWETANNCLIEIDRRAAIRAKRNDLKFYCTDPLTYELGRRHLIGNVEYHKKLFMKACFSLGFAKLHTN